MTSNRKKLLVITLGEATFDLIIPLIENGELPAFKKFFEEGTTGVLGSSVPMVTPQMWGNVFTGKNPGEHGLFDFWQRGKDGKFIEINGSNIKTKAVWDILSENGLNSGIVNIPFTFPPRKIKGFMISGEDAPGAHRSIAYPSSIYDEIVEKFGRYRLKDIFPGGRKKEDYLTLVEEDVNRQTEVVSYLIENKNWDFFMSFFSATAITQHYFWKDMQMQNNVYKDIIKTAYKSLDASIERLIRAAGPDTNIIIFSECGAGPLASGIQINTWLQKEGFLTYNKSMNLSASKDGQESFKVSFTRSKVAGFRKNIQSLLPQSWYFFANKNVHWLKNWIQSYMADSDIHWEKTRAFSRGKEGGIYINLKGRDPKGIVEKAQYDEVRDEIIRKFKILNNPFTGIPVVKQIHKREELYSGDFMDFAPDLLIEWIDGAYMPAENDKDKDSIFVERWRENMNWPTSGSHRDEGILLAKGPDIAKNKKVKNASIIDLTPTWLSLLKLNVPGDIEGKVIKDLQVDDNFKSDFTGKILNEI
ncbi:MAG: alkaline phosphatase family protein [Ignavibacteriaceae bacterium]